MLLCLSVSLSQKVCSITASLDQRNQQPSSGKWVSWHAQARIIENQARELPKWRLADARAKLVASRVDRQSNSLL